MTFFCTVLCFLLKNSKSEAKTAGDIFTDKRFFTDKPLIKTKNDYFLYNMVFFAGKYIISCLSVKNLLSVILATFQIVYRKVDEILSLLAKFHEI